MQLFFGTAEDFVSKKKKFNQVFARPLTRDITSKLCCFSVLNVKITCVVVVKNCEFISAWAGVCFNNAMHTHTTKSRTIPKPATTRASSSRKSRIPSTATSSSSASCSSSRTSATAKSSRNKKVSKNASQMSCRVRL